MLEHVSSQLKEGHPQLQLSPNSCTNVFRINTPCLYDIKRIQICQLDGELVSVYSDEVSFKEDIDISQLPDDKYLVVIQIDKKVVTKKLFKIDNKKQEPEKK